MGHFKCVTVQKGPQGYSKLDSCSLPRTSQSFPQNPLPTITCLPTITAKAAYFRKRHTAPRILAMEGRRCPRSLHSHPGLLTFSCSRSNMAARCASRFSLLDSIFWASFSLAILMKLLFSSMAFWITSRSCSLFSARCFRSSASWYWKNTKRRRDPSK